MTLVSAWEQEPPLQYGEARDGYWTSNKCIAVKIAEVKYKKEKSYRLFWIFGQSGCHMAHADDSLNVHCMNAKEGGSQSLMHDTIYNGKHISMTLSSEKAHRGESFYTPRNDRCIATERKVPS